MDISKDLLSKEFLSQFKSQEDVSRFMKDLHAKVYEDLLEREMDLHLGYEKHSVDGNNSGNSRNGSYGKRLQRDYPKFWIVPLNHFKAFNLAFFYINFGFL